MGADRAWLSNGVDGVRRLTAWVGMTDLGPWTGKNGMTRRIPNSAPPGGVVKSSSAREAPLSKSKFPSPRKKAGVSRECSEERPRAGVLLLSRDEKLAAEVQDALGSMVGTPCQLHWATSLDAIGQELADKNLALMLVDLAQSADGRDSNEWWRHLTLGNSAPAPIVPVVSSSSCYPLELASQIDNCCSGRLNRPIVASSLHDLLLQAMRTPRRQVELGEAQLDPAVLKGRSVRFQTREPKLGTILEDVKMVAAHDVTVMLVGETGSGKTTLAKLFHELSPRHQESFMHVACGALPPTLIESELFGHVKGAFTGADRNKLGKFEAAGEGTILLDEIDALTLEQQVKLLRVIETREFEPVGSNETRSMRARLIVASNVCLETLVANNRFRNDLYYRLNVLKFHLLPLRERPRDVAPLALEFVESAAAKCGVAIKGVHPSFIDTLRAYHWPGNLRELNNCMERAVVLCRGGILTATCLPPAILQGERHPNPTSTNASNQVSLVDKVAVSERTIIREVLRRHGFRRTPAAQELGVSRVTLYNKMKKYGLLEELGRPGRTLGEQVAD